MTLQEIIASIKKHFDILKIEEKAEKYAQIEVNEMELRNILLHCKHNLNFVQLSAISTVDYIKDNKFSLVYNLFSYEDSIVLGVKILIDREKAEFVTITDIYKPAIFFERDIHEMLGINFIGNNHLEKFILDEWVGPPPMRKDFDTVGYVNETFDWLEYDPEWAKKLGIKKEDLNGEELEIL
jgi:NADH-quinone oxidoreductase subunit C